MVSGANLRALRLDAGLTQHEVATRVGIATSVLSAYERERREPGVLIASRIIEAMGLRVCVVAGLDPQCQADRLLEVLELAESLPYRSRGLGHMRGFPR